MLLPTMTLDEIYNAVSGDVGFVLRKLDVAVKEFRRAAIKTRSFPFKRKYNYKNYKSNTVYTIYLSAFTRSQWDNPIVTVATSYTHDGGTTVIVFDFGNKNKEIALIESHCLARFKERYLQNSSYTTQEIIDFLLWNFNTLSMSKEVMRIDEELQSKNEDSEYFALVSSLGVFYCEHLADNQKVTIYHTYLSMEMLKKEQNRKIALNYLWAYFKDYMDSNPKVAKQIDVMIDEFVAQAEHEQWSIDKFITESEKLMDKYPLYVL